MSNRWESEILRFEEEDRVSPPAPGGIVFAGSSTFRLWSNLAAVFPQYGVINRGFGGARVHDVTAYAVRTVAPYKPRQVIVYTGGMISRREPRQRSLYKNLSSAYPPWPLLRLVRAFQ